VVFDLEKNSVRLQGQLDDKRRIFDVRVYFKDFYGNADHIIIKLSIDITEFDKIVLPPQPRPLIHPYSDAATCATELRCLKLEEMVANKLKCLLQRRHIPDVYDLVHAVFINREIVVDRSEVLTTFLRKTIYQPSPGVARQLFLHLPLYALKGAWERYIIAPLQGVLDFDAALGHFQSIINELFAAYPENARASFVFFPASLRMPLMEAGSDRRLVRLIYDGVSRTVEPYALAYKRRKDGHGEEYLYVYDRTGGHSSGPGIKSLLNHKISGLEVLEEKFEPRFPIELGKAGEFGGRDYFTGGGSHARRGFGSRFRALRHGWRYTIECPYCSRRFKRMRMRTALKPHRDGQGYVCAGRTGLIVGQELV
jgi:hypothetical protein